MLVGKGPSSNNYQKLCRKTRYESAIAKHITVNKKAKVIKVLKTLIQDKGQSFRNYVKHGLVA